MSELIRKLKEKKFITKIKVKDDISDELISKEIPQTGSVKIVAAVKEEIGPVAPEIVVTRETNPELMDICVAEGWAANSDYMTYKEAALITDKMIEPRKSVWSWMESESKFTTLTHFEEFQWFEGIQEIPAHCFYRCAEIANIVIPNSVTSIGSDTFKECSELASITIPDSVTSIGNNTFQNCSKLTSITIGNSVTSIGEYAFNGCSGLTSITIPNSVASIGSGAFSYCSGLTSITIPNSVTSIGNNAFQNCSKLTSITIGNSVTSIGEYAFDGCSGLESIVIESGNSKYDSRDNCNAIIETDTNTLLLGCKNTIIPDSITSIGNYAFHDCTGLTSIVIPNSVISIGDSAFYSCSNLTDITIGNSVTSIGDSAFTNCNLVSIVIGSGNSKYDSRDNCNAIIETDTNTLIIGCKNTIIPDSVNSIGSGAFYNCSGLTSITIPDSVTSIGRSAFEDCSSLTSVTIGNSVTSIGDQVFYNCSNLTNITIGNSVTSIGGSAFSYCSGLTSITIPDGVTSIGDSAFYNCSALSSITCLATTAPTVSSSTFGSYGSSYTGRNTYDQGINKLKVPTGATGYDTSYWKDPLQNSSKCGFTIEYI